MNKLIIFVALSLLWLLLSGVYTLLLVSLGAVSVVLVMFIVYRMRILDRKMQLHLVLPLIRYNMQLCWEILKANLEVCRLVMSPKLPISPVMVKIHTLPKTELGRVILANSITLTPGTVSVSVDNDEITVHALTTKALEGLNQSTMGHRIANFGI